MLAKTSSLGLGAKALWEKLFKSTIRDDNPEYGKGTMNIY